MMRARHFKLYELLPPELYTDEDHGWELFDNDLIAVIDWVRELVGRPMVANTWHSGGTYKYRGYRPADCGVGARLSAHKEGRACDLVCYGVTAENIRKMIAANSASLPCAIRLERGVKWLHIDTRNKGRGITYFDG